MPEKIITDSPFVELFLNASLPVQAVMVLLVFMSLYSWTLIFRKRAMLKHARADAWEFEDHFRQGGDLNVLYADIKAMDCKPAGMEPVFIAGYTEFVRLRKQSGVEPMALVEGSRRAMRAALHREIDELETYLPALATIGSVSPYIGLFGTVWGIMRSFHSLTDMEQATLAMVAPGISEALIATALGLFAAIPAVIAYNNYGAGVDRLITRYEIFAEEFTGVLQRQAHAIPAHSAARQVHKE
ncbi:MAG: protein TolQ [Gammaproteobacteria bacterium]|nr:protein TolQ [Gammaproteobacteria bacterium]